VERDLLAAAIGGLAGGIGVRVRYVCTAQYEEASDYATYFFQDPGFSAHTDNYTGRRFSVETYARPTLVKVRENEAMKKPVEFGRGVETGYEERTYTSKCGNFKIESYALENCSVKVGYSVFKKVGTEWAVVRDCGDRTADSLRAAKLWACWEIDPNYEG
jgi:hypothetical protein